MFGNVVLSVLAGVILTMVWVVLVLVALAVLFVFVRFLLVGTRAAQVYISRNEPARPGGPAADAQAPTPKRTKSAAAGSKSASPQNPSSPAKTPAKPRAKAAPAKASPKKP